MLFVLICACALCHHLFCVIMQNDRFGCLLHGKPLFSKIRFGAKEMLCCAAQPTYLKRSPALTHLFTMYSALLNRLIATVVVCGLCLQGCRSSLQITSEEPVAKKSRRASDAGQVTDRASAPGIQPYVLSDAPNSKLSTVSSAMLPSMASSTVQVALSTHHLAVGPDTVSGREQASSTESEETDKKPAAGLTSVFGVQEWSRYFGEIGIAPPLPSDIDEILDGPCPFWQGKQVKDTHLLVLLPTKVDDRPFSLDLLVELIQHPKGGGYSTEYDYYDSDVQEQLGAQSPVRPYWVLMTRDVLAGSRGKKYSSQQALVAAYVKRTKLPYELPGALEAATAILSHYVRSGERLYTDAPWTYTWCEDLVAWGSDNYLVVVGGFSSGGLLVCSRNHGYDGSGVASLRRFMEEDRRSAAVVTAQVAELPSDHALPYPVSTSVFGVEEWCQYFGEVGVAPPLPSDIDQTLNGSCPFWTEKKVRDTHLLVLIPATVNGKPFSLTLLGELVQQAQGGGYSTQYRYYGSSTKKQFGAQSPPASYWVLMTRDVLEDSRGRTYSSQQALLAGHAKRTKLPYELPSVLEAATAILSHYVHSGERLYTDTPCTWTWCRELAHNRFPVVVGGFSSGGLSVSGSHNDFSYTGYGGVAGLRKFVEEDMKPAAVATARVARLPSVFGAEEWRQYFGEVGVAPPLPSDIDQILGSPCPFWSGKRVRDTHLLVLIPATVNGKPFSLNLLGELVRYPQGRGYSTEFNYYDSDVQGRFGTQSPVRSYWVLMTHGVLKGSRSKKYASQQALVAYHASRAGLPYELPGTLEAATAILSHYVRSGERLYANAPWTYTRCQDLVLDEDGDECPVVVGGFFSGGLNVYYHESENIFSGVAGLRRF
jgi:hypothetical protein